MVLPGRLPQVVRSFEDEYGIKVEIPVTTLDGNAQKLMAKKSGPTGDIDVVGWD